VKVLMLEWKSYGTEDLLEAYHLLEIETNKVPFLPHVIAGQEKYRNELKKQIESNDPDYVFSFNYFPGIAEICHQLNVKYVSWIYDSPYVQLYSYTTIYPTNYIFVFDKQLYMEFYNAQITTVYYLPLAVNTRRLSTMTDGQYYQNAPWKNRADIAFVGALYTENHNFYRRMETISQYTKGYLEAVIAAQKHIYGYNFVQEVMTTDVLEDMKHSLGMTAFSDNAATEEYLYAQYVINREITAEERIEILTAIGEQYNIDLYTKDKSVKIKGVYNHGMIDYYDMTPYVYKHAKINLNITLRSIASGIPLRAFDILGAGGFLLTNYQADFGDCYEAGTDYIYYDNQEDMLEKIGYFLGHEKERKEIAHNGFVRSQKDHTYEKRLERIHRILKSGYDNGE
jgi:hypothetical protein